MDTRAMFFHYHCCAVARINVLHLFNQLVRVAHHSMVTGSGHVHLKSQVQLMSKTSTRLLCLAKKADPTKILMRYGNVHS